MKTKSLIRINYKSGIQEELWVKFFNIEYEGFTKKFNWESFDPKQKILFLNPNEIESIYQIDSVEYEH